MTTWARKKVWCGNTFAELISMTSTRNAKIVKIQYLENMVCNWYNKKKTHFRDCKIFFSFKFQPQFNN